MIYQHNWQKAADLQHEDFASDRKQVRKNSYNSDASDDKQSLLPFSSCHSTAGMQVASDEDSIASFGAGQMGHVAPTDHAMFNKYSLHKSQSLLWVLEFQAALRIQGFFRRAAAWYKLETSRLQVEKMDVLRRQKEELETIQLLLDMEKQKARMELREDEEGKSVSTPDDSSKTFAWSYFASLKNHRNELRLGTKGYLELKRQIDSLTLQNKQFEGLVELGKRAMVKAKTEVAKAGAQLQKETAKKEKVQDCIVKVVNLLRASNDDRLAKKVLGSAREVLPNKLEEALQSIDETRPVKNGKPRSATLLGKAANDAAKEAHSSVRKSTRSRRSSDTTLVTTAKAKELKCEMDWEKRRRVSMNKKPMRRQRSKSCSSMPKLHRSKTAESQSKRNILRRQNSRSCSNVNGDANEDPAPLLSLIESAYSGATTKESQPRRKSLRRQRRQAKAKQGGRALGGKEANRILMSMRLLKMIQPRF
ncbi:expressed unknown protein [Seminavis robusta]|uniref:Uncharacterized protein n=1 Tax=Seminavis robusta TaxID=568900 RepID=A0A9N8HW56_9STRA|nr:expressed unknown protein [Seminavis robusta]|eukprot:Sro1920_g305500.1 n/a (477) ;mRNA; r:10285-11800